MSLDVFSMAAIGGLGSVSGALLGVFTFRFLEKVLSGELRMAVTGAGLLVGLLVLPGGLGQFVTDVRDRLLRLLPDRDDGAPPPPAEVDLLSEALEAPVEVEA
jgi:hypothetical protein